MATEPELYAAVLADPVANDPRYAYAEAVGGPRAELIRVQLRLHRTQKMQYIPNDLGELVTREKALLAAHGDEWSREVKPLVDKLMFERGFIDWVELPVAKFLESAETLYRLAPVIHLTLSHARGRTAELFASPHLARIRGLSLRAENVGDEGAAALAASPYVAELRWLDLAYNGLTETGMEALVASSNLKNLAYARLDGNVAEDICDSAGGIDGNQILDWQSSKLGRLLEKKHGARKWMHYQVTDERFRFPTMGYVD